MYMVIKVAAGRQQHSQVQNMTPSPNSRSSLPFGSTLLLSCMQGHTNRRHSGRSHVAASEAGQSKHRTCKSSWQLAGTSSKSSSSAGLQGVILQPHLWEDVDLGADVLQVALRVEAQVVGHGDPQDAAAALRPVVLDERRDLAPLAHARAIPQEEPRSFA